MNPVAAELCAGTLGGVAGIIAGMPFDTIKVRLQTQNAAAPIYRGTMHCLWMTVRQESIRGLYKGMSSPLAGVAAQNAIVFGVHGASMGYLKENTLTNQLLSGMLAGAVQTLVTCPVEFAKTKMQIQGIIDGRNGTKRSLYRTPAHFLYHVYSTQGTRAVFRGFTVTLTRELPGFGSYFWSFEYLTRLMAPQRADGTKGQPGVGALLLAGGLAGTISWLACFPQDVIKSRFQGNEKYTSAWQCAWSSYRQEGLKVFARGLWPTLLRAFPHNAATLTIYQLFMRRYASAGSSTEQTALL